MSKRLKHSRIYGPIKEQKGWGECVCMRLGGGGCRPQSFLLTDAGPRGESQERRRKRWWGKFSQRLLGSGESED